MLISPQSAPAFHAVEGLARAVSEAEGLDDILAVALDALQGLIGAHRASVLLTDDDGVMRFRAWRGLSDGYRAAVEGHSPWPADADDPQPILIEDVSQADLGHLREVVIREGIGALGFVPLVYRKRLIGKFMLYYDAPHVVTPGRLMLARTVARLVGLAVGRFEGEVAQKRARDELAAVLAAVGDGITVQDAEGRVEYANQAAAQMLGCASAEDLRGAGPDELRLRYEVADEEGAPLPSDRVPGRMAIAQRGTAEALISYRRGRDRRWARVRSTALPVEPGRAPLAVNVMQDVTEQRQQDARRQFLLDAAEALSSSLDLDATLRRITELAVPRLADGAAILMRDAPPDQATVWHRDPAVVQRIREVMARWPIRPNEGAGHLAALSSGRAQHVRAAAEADLARFAHGGSDHLADLKSLGIGSWVVVPLRGRREPIGTITLINGPERAPLDEHDLALLRELADRAAAAIENARLYRELRESQERLSDALEAGRMGTWEWDVPNDRLTWSAFVASIHGATGREPRSILDFVGHMHPEDREAGRARIEAALRDGAELDLQYRGLRSDGAVRWFEGHSRIHRDEQGRPVRLAGVCADITHRKQAEIDLAAERERLATTLRSIGDAVVTTDTAGRVRMLNPVAEDLLGWSQAEATGRPVQDVFVLRPDSRGEHPVSAALSGGSARTTRRPAVVVARDGTEREIAHTTAPIRGRDGDPLGAVLVFRDVTGEKRVEAELARASKLESLGVLAGGIAHDFNNVLTAITANLSIAERRLSPSDPARERIATASRATERARDLTNQLLTFARGGAPVKASTSIDQIIRDSVSFALQGARSRAEVDLPRELWAVDADAGQIGQVLHNLVLNADQAMPTGGIVRVDAANVTIAAGTSLPLAPGEYVRIRVRDQGVGIPAEHISRIFDPFFTTRPQGTGLGLATSYSIVHRHGGHLAVRSEEGKGATFCLWLPRAWAEPEIGTEEEAVVGATGGRVLVMDDDRSIRDLAGDCLRELGYEPSFALDGREAVDRYEAAVAEGRPFDAVILDLTVPGGMGGREAMAVLRERWPAARVIVSSGYSNDPVIARYREQGFAGVLQKPYRVDDVARALAAALDDAEPLRGGPAPGLVSPGGVAG
jgi:PAS domain S-box-containing protein